MERRSTKSKTARRRYTVDAFEGIEELRDIVSDDEAPVTPADDHESSGEEFEVRSEHSFDEDGMSGLDDNLVEDASDGSSNAGEQLLDDGDSIMDDRGDNNPARPPRKRVKKPKHEASVQGPKTYTRAMSDRADATWHGSKEARLLFFYGISTNGLEPLQAAWKRWFRDLTLPSRVAALSGMGGMRHSFAAADKTSEADEVWKWWSTHGGKDEFHQKQILDPIDSVSILGYMPEKQGDDLPFLMGPFKSQRVYRLPVGQSVALIDAWKQDPRNHDSGDSTISGFYKRGFMLHLGAKVHCLDWAPNQKGQDQYLAAAVLLPHPDTRASSEAPAFTAQQPYNSNIQIWRFQSCEEGSIQTEVAPTLELVLCTSWGDVKSLKWCPMPRDTVNEPDRKRLGLLAGIWSDGAVRILDVSFSLSRTTTSYLHVKQAAFESRPAATLCTCLAWISSSRVAAGCANGCIAVWDLPTSLKSSSTNARPLIYSSVSTSYILSIVTCYPSAPKVLLATSMAGHISMTDLSRCGQPLLSPAATVYGNRVRVSQPLLIWHDFAQFAIHATDSFLVKGSTIRRIFANIGLGRAKSNCTSLASSQCHPLVLVGGANGDVFTMNPLRRVMHAKPIIWQQTWFAHEWRRLSPEEQTASGQPEPNNDVAQPASGFSRISEGFKAERKSLANYDQWAQRYNSYEGTMFATIYEEKSAITALAWNPNPHVGGWAAAGMGDGLLRVEDMAT